MYFGLISIYRLGAPDKVRIFIYRTSVSWPRSCVWPLVGIVSSRRF